MSAQHNVGRLDSNIRIVLGGVCIGLILYHFAVSTKQVLSGIRSVRRDPAGSSEANS